MQTMARDGLLVSTDVDHEPSEVDVAGVPIGPRTFTIIAGPCAVESYEQTLASAVAARDAGARILRGGAYKPRTSPYTFQGLGSEGLTILAEVRKVTGLPIVTEVVDARDVESVAGQADMLQIGARNMQNFTLLREVGLTDKPVMLKRGMTATVDEWILAAEHIAHTGNLQIVLCERGIRTFEPSTRGTLDLSAVPVARQRSHLPVIVDPSHAAGRRDLIGPLARAAAAVGADGVMMEVHPDPDRSWSDAAQALHPTDLARIASELIPLARSLGRSI